MSALKPENAALGGAGMVVVKLENGDGWNGGDEVGIKLVQYPVRQLGKLVIESVLDGAGIKLITLRVQRSYTVAALASLLGCEPDES